MSETKTDDKGRRRGGAKGTETKGGEEMNDSDKNMLRRIAHGVASLQESQDATSDRLDNLEDIISQQTGEQAAPVSQRAPRAFRDVRDRAIWEGKVRDAASFRVEAVSATGLLGSQQEETLAVLDRQQGVHESVQEVVVEMAAHLTKHEILKKARGKKDWRDTFAKLFPWVAGLVVGVVALEGLFQPANFQLVISGLSETRNFLIVVTLIAVGIGLYAYSIFSKRRVQKQSQ